MDFEQAWPYVEKARAIAKERGLVITVAVHDDAGHPVALARGKNWHGPYMQNESGIPSDPWGNPYIYLCPGKHNPSSYDIISLGPDGREGTEDDITNWQQNKR